MTLGDSQFSFTSGLSGLGVAERGVSFERHTDTSKLAFFVGAIGDYFEAPFASTFGGATAGAGVFYERGFQHVKLSTLEVVQGHRYTALESGTLDWRGLTATGTVGYLENARQLQAQVSYRPFQHFFFLASHSTYVLGSTHAIVKRTAASAAVGRFDAYRTGFHGAQGFGESFGGAVRPFDFLAVRESVALEPRQPPLFLTTSTEMLQRWSLSQSWSSNAGHSSFALGGGYHSNRFSASIGQQILYNVATSRFEQATVAQLVVHISNGSVNLGASVNSSERVYLYAVSGQDFIGEPASPRGHDVSWISKAKYVVSGQVLDAKGNPVEGAAVKVGDVVAYTDASGTFEVRFKKSASVAFAVMLDEFASPGIWHVLQAPSVASPGESVSVVVGRVK